MMQIPAVDFTDVYPEVTIALVGMLVLAVDIFIRPKRKASLAVIALVGLLLALLTTLAIWDRNGTSFSGMVAVDPYAQFFKLIFILSAALTVLMSPRYLDLYNISIGEYFELILFCTLGMMVMVAANDLITIYIGLELMAISIYLMAGFQKENPRSCEASMKYFLLGAFASAILLYGMSFFYGITGTTNLQGISRYLDFTQNLLNFRLITLSLVLMTVGFAFKIAAVPFHMWTPDVYEGAPTPLTAFMSVGPKVAGFAVIMRVYMTVFDTLVPDWIQLFWMLSVLTMIFGNVVAVAQQNIKRMLAYSSIAHAGYLLIGIVSAGSATELTNDSTLATALTSESMMSVMVYLFAYMFMNLGAFGVVIALGRTDDPRESLQDYAGLAERRPLTAMLMTILLLSLTGIPPTFGFVGKLYIFKAAILTDNVSLAVIGVLTSVVAAYYYIRVIVYMYMREPEGEVLGEGEAAGSTMYAVIVASIFTLLFGIAPGTIIVMARYTIERMLA
ncbi:MAG: NADH-quinone oxidoreductase subunit N [Candidatus Hydrogenedentota bacterium]|nr:MAG: NADH-quinone oxidoreductase subunit N [Candidatus Hydrogenedentota bacterium]